LFPFLGRDRKKLRRYSRLLAGDIQAAMDLEILLNDPSFFEQFLHCSASVLFGKIVTYEDLRTLNEIKKKDSCKGMKTQTRAALVRV